ncbi:MAG: DUF4861 family protein [Prolixibacteraceae bacterium]|nr:DUF4861 family protein [Prolixibacteraceae bacterium]
MSKIQFLIVTIASLFLVSCESKPTIVLVNNSDSDLTGKSVVIARSELEKRTGLLPEKESALLTDKFTGKKYAAQLDDIDLDGKWDELFVQLDFKANKGVSLQIDFDLADEDDVLFKALTNVRFADANDPDLVFTKKERLKSNTTEIIQTVFQFEGPGWENDLVGFRNYFDARNGIDIFGKTVSEMILDQCGLKDGSTYHERQPWGMDILKVGNSLGAGALALEYEDSLYRVGPGCKGVYTLVKEGPLRSIIDFDFEGIQIDNFLLNLKHRVSIEAGKPFYKSQVWIDGTHPVKLVTGIVNLHSDSVYSVSSEDYSFFYTYDNQAYEGEKLGMAVIALVNNLSVDAAPEEGDGITQTFYTSFDCNSQPVEFYFMAGWEEQDAVYSAKSGFENEVAKQAQQIAANIDFDM